MSKSKAARIEATGAYLPNNIVTNHDLTKTLDTSDEWIRSRTGIQQRHIVTEGENALTMAKAAAQDALQVGQIDPHSIDLIVCATATPEMMFPSTAAMLQNELGIRRSIIAFDISAACGGFVYALAVAEQFIKSGMASRGLVVGSEVNSSAIDWTDRSTCVLFGDGAGAFILGHADAPGIEGIELHCKGQYKDILYFRNRWMVDSDKDGYVVMDGQEVFKVAVTELSRSAQSILASHDLTVDDIDWFIPHQANARIIEAIAKKLQLSNDKIINTLQYHGNTSSASIPLAMTKALRDGKIKRGDRILFQAIGSGMVWGSALAIY